MDEFLQVIKFLLRDYAEVGLISQSCYCRYCREYEDFDGKIIHASGCLVPSALMIISDFEHRNG